jgi:S1-C subfamily serine protease
MFSKTVTGLLAAAVLAVFFSGTGFAADSSLTTLESGMSDLVYRLSRSIVTVETSWRVTPRNGAAGGAEAVRRLVSTGVVYDTLGHVIVAAPMVLGNDRIVVRLGRDPVAAELVAVDYHTNLALIRCVSPVGDPVSLSQKQSCAGHMVVALGNAYGLRAAPALGFCAGVRQDGLLQFSVPITSGAVGGGVFNMDGELLGLITAAVGSENRIALAVPAFRLPDIATILMTGRDRHSGFLGVQSTEIEIVPPLEISAPVRLASSGSVGTKVIDRGVVITKIVPGSPAARAGLALGDLLVSYNGKPVTSAAELAQIVQCSFPGTQGRLELVRKNHFLVVEITIGQKDLASSVPMSGGESYFNDSPGNSLSDSLTQAIIQLREQLNAIETRVHQLQ